jgi:hypothetical protein
LAKISTASQDNSATTNRRFEFQKRQSASHPHAQRSAFRRRDARLQSRSFARWNQSLRHSPNSNQSLLRLSAMISQYFTRDRVVTLPRLSSAKNFLGSIVAFTCSAFLARARRRFARSADRHAVVGNQKPRGASSSKLRKGNVVR